MIVSIREKQKNNHNKQRINIDKEKSISRKD